MCVNALIGVVRVCVCARGQVPFAAPKQIRGTVSAARRACLCLSTKMSIMEGAGLPPSAVCFQAVAVSQSLSLRSSSGEPLFSSAPTAKRGGSSGFRTQ